MAVFRRASLTPFGWGLECAPAGGQIGGMVLNSWPGFRRVEAMVRRRTHSIEFKRQVVQDCLASETLHSLAKRHDLSRNLVRIWVGSSSHRLA